MQEHATDPGVYVRSMAARGHLGGLAVAAPEAIRVLEAAGCDTVLVETVGVGQSEVEVVGAADTVVVLVAPGAGDAVQVAKAGLLEIGDVYVVNKADRDGADVVVRDLRQAIGVAPPSLGRGPDGSSVRPRPRERASTSCSRRSTPTPSGRRHRARRRVVVRPVPPARSRRWRSPACAPTSTRPGRPRAVRRSCRSSRPRWPQVPSTPGQRSTDCSLPRRAERSCGGSSC